MVRKRGRTLALVCSAVFALVLMACGSSAGSAAPAGSAAAGAATAPAAGAADPAAGAVLFTSAGCADCHAVAAGAAAPEGGTNLAGFWAGNGIYKGILGNFKRIEDANVIDYIREGNVGKVGKMPAHPDLTDEQLQQLVDYLKTLDG